MVIMLMILLPAFTGTGIVGFTGEDKYPDEGDDSTIAYFPMDWVGIQVNQFPMSLKVSISIFALFVVYLGGRSKNKRFNDRTLDVNIFSRLIFLKTALFRAVFIFRLLEPCIDPCMAQTNNRLIIIPSSKFPCLGGISP